MISIGNFVLQPFLESEWKSAVTNPKLNCCKTCFLLSYSSCYQLHACDMHVSYMVCASLKNMHVHFWQHACNIRVSLSRFMPGTLIKLLVKDKLLWKKPVTVWLGVLHIHFWRAIGRVCTQCSPNFTKVSSLIAIRCSCFWQEVSVLWHQHDEIQCQKNALKCTQTLSTN